MFNHSSSDQARLDSLTSSGLLSGKTDMDFDRVTALAARMLKVPACLVTLVDHDRQVFAGACGIPEAYAEKRETPLSHSFCKHVVTLRRPLVITDARTDPFVMSNPAVTELGVNAYLGFPLVAPDHHIYGAFCVIDVKPREWTEEEIALIRDFTAIVAEQIELHVAKRRERTITDVLIHDLRSPLSSIRLISGLLTEQKIPADRLQALGGTLTDSAERIAHLLRAVEDLHRDEAGGCRDLGRLLDSHMNEIGDTALEKGLSLRREYTAYPLPIATAEWVIGQIAENLLGNAVKFTPRGGEIRVTIGSEGPSGFFTIEDNGPGFQADDYPRLFKRYARLSALPTGNEISTGLGLSIVKRLADRAGGSVTLLSKPGEGARFKVSFPLGLSLR
ncbi:GAF domain-containing sensor histidine kinase [Luteolibacter sp. GHJ8]|uniref:histidine kinase n=1 Tax=Luteolibacter rhizosphaerae TaxID=2989719 RepID=A0ABT3G1Y8_9BACT|nr:GAF domain-containing sensor histidine kinase [Luteolibacter rhizosphaerae]MCW1913845.1 GAF domain-containing sensor histidine kinase [Luteolibacter rhizosphaerae]